MTQQCSFASPRDALQIPPAFPADSTLSCRCTALLAPYFGVHATRVVPRSLLKEDATFYRMKGKLFFRCLWVTAGLCKRAAATGIARGAQLGMLLASDVGCGTRREPPLRWLPPCSLTQNFYVEFGSLRCFSEIESPTQTQNPLCVSRVRSGAGAIFFCGRRCDQHTTPTAFFSPQRNDMLCMGVTLTPVRLTFSCVVLSVRNLKYPSSQTAHTLAFLERSYLHTGGTDRKRRAKSF